MNPPKACCRFRSSAVKTDTSRAGSFIGNGLRKTSLISVKIVVLAPMPSPSDNAATKVRIGLRESRRTANRRSFRIVPMSPVYSSGAEFFPPSARFGRVPRGTGETFARAANSPWCEGLAFSFSDDASARSVVRSQTHASTSPMARPLDQRRA